MMYLALPESIRSFLNAGSVSVACLAQNGHWKSENSTMAIDPEPATCVRCVASIVAFTSLVGGGGAAAAAGFRLNIVQINPDAATMTRTVLRVSRMLFAR